MRNLNKILIVITAIFIFFLTSCTSFESTCNVKLIYANKEEVITINEGEKLEVPLDDYLFGHEFIGWYLNDELYDFNTKVTSNITLVAKHIKKDYVPKWELNESGFNGNNVKIKIYFDQRYSNKIGVIDPYSEDYIYTDKEDRIKHLIEVENAYNIDIVFEGYEDFEEQVIQSLITGERNVIFNLRSNQLINIVEEIGLYEFPEKYYVGNENISKLTSSFGYGNYNTVNHLMYYDKKTIYELGLEDPAELWLQGKWTINNFDEYLLKISQALDKQGIQKPVLNDCYDNLLIGLSNSYGQALINDWENTNFNHQYMNEILTKINNWHEKGYFGKFNLGHNYFQSNSVLVYGPLYEEAVVQYSKLEEKSKMGIVPFPINDKDVEYLLNDNLAESSYKVPFSERYIYTIPLYSGEEVPNDVLANIVYDLVGGYNGISGFLHTEYVDVKEHEEIFASVINVQNPDIIDMLYYQWNLTGCFSVNENLYYLFKDYYDGKFSVTIVELPLYFDSIYSVPLDIVNESFNKFSNQGKKK